MQTHMNGKQKKEIAYDCQPPKAGPEIFIQRLKGGQKFTFTILSITLFGVWVHWDGKRSFPHYHPAEQCQGCMDRRQKRWKGFLHCFNYEIGQEVFLELTPFSATSLRNQLAGSDNLRGNRIQVSRTKGDNGRLVVQVLTAIQNPEALPPEKDPKASILKLWGMEPDEGDGLDPQDKPENDPNPRFRT